MCSMSAGSPVLSYLMFLRQSETALSDVQHLAMNLMPRRCISMMLSMPSEPQTRITSGAQQNSTARLALIFSTI